MRLLLAHVRPLADPAIFVRALRTVCPERRRLALRHRAVADRCRSLAAALLLAEALRAAGLSPREAAAQQRSPTGKPFCPARPDIHFNLSHAGEYAACVLGAVPCGLDLEQKLPLPEKLPEAALHPAELAHWAASPPHMRPCLFARLWTRKEAFLKLLGLGLGLNPASLNTAPERPRLVWQGSVYTFRDYEVPDHALSLCLPEGTAFPPLEAVSVPALLHNRPASYNRPSIS